MQNDSLVSVDENDYADMESAQEFAYDKFIEMIRVMGSE